MPKQTDFELSPEDRSKLESWMRSGKTEHRLVRRAEGLGQSGFSYTWNTKRESL